MNDNDVHEDLMIKVPTFGWGPIYMTKQLTCTKALKIFRSIFESNWEINLMR